MIHLLALLLLASCYCPLPHRGPACDCDQHKMCSECEPIQSSVSTESDREIQQAYEELADFSFTRDIVWTVEGHWTVTLAYNRNGDGQDHWIVWKVTGANLKKVVDTVEKDVYDFPEGHERTK